MKKFLTVTFVVFTTTMCAIAQKDSLNTTATHKAKKDFFNPLYVGIAGGVKNSNVGIWSATLLGVLNFNKTTNIQKLKFGIFYGFNAAFASASALGNKSKLVIGREGVPTIYDGDEMKYSVYAGGVVMHKKLQIGIGVCMWHLTDYEHYEEEGVGLRLYARYSDILLISADVHNFFGYILPIKLKKINIGVYGNSNGFGPAVMLKGNKKPTSNLTIFTTVKNPTIGVGLTFN